eukprot:410799-Pyramimonas_sp.AAC.1
MGAAPLHLIETNARISSVPYNILNSPAQALAPRYQRWFNDMFVILRRAMAYAFHRAGVVDGIRCIPTTHPGTEQHASATTERNYQKVAGLP